MIYEFKCPQCNCSLTKEEIRKLYINPDSYKENYKIFLKTSFIFTCCKCSCRIYDLYCYKFAKAVRQEYKQCKECDGFGNIYENDIEIINGCNICLNGYIKIKEERLTEFNIHPNSVKKTMSFY